MPTNFILSTGLTAYARANDADNTAVDLTEGAGLNAGTYQVTDSEWHDAGLPSSLPGSHLVRAFQGTAGAQSADDIYLNSSCDYAFDGTNEALPVAQILSDIDQTPVPQSRTWVPVRAKGGLLADPIYIAKSELPALFAIDYRNDLPSNGRVSSVSSVTQTGGIADALTFEASARDHSQAKAVINSTVAGAFTIATTSVYDRGSPGVGTAVVQLVVEDG